MTYPFNICRPVEDLVSSSLFERPLQAEVLNQPSMTDRLKKSLQHIQQDQRLLAALQDVKRVYDQNKTNLIRGGASTSCILVKDSSIKVCLRI